MKIQSIAFEAMLAAVAAWPTLLSAESPSHDRQTITPAFKETIPNIPGKSLVGLLLFIRLDCLKLADAITRPSPMNLSTVPFSSEIARETFSK